MAVGGDIIEVTYSHPTIGQGSFFPKANEGNTFDPGGIRTADDASQIAGAGEFIAQKNRVRGSFEVVCVNDMNTRNDIEVVQQLAADPVPADYTVSVINGTVWKASGFPVGDLQADVNASTFTLKIGATRWEKIVG